MGQQLEGHLFRAAISATANTTTVEIVAAVTGKRIAVIAYAFTSTAAAAFAWLSASTALSGGMRAGIDAKLQDQHPEGLMVTAVGEALNLSRGASTAIGGYILYRLTD